MASVVLHPPPVRVFINYRHEDTEGWALLIRKCLEDRFGAENVFLDTTLLPGVKWLEEIKARNTGCAVFLALIGPDWKPSIIDRSRAGAKDFVRLEIETALKRGSGVEVIPVVVGSASPPTPDGLPPSLRPLTELQVAHLHRGTFDEDMQKLIRRIGEFGPRPPKPVGAPQVRVPVPPSLPARPGSVAPSPDPAHFETVLRHMVDEGDVVPVLGSRLNSRDGDPWTEGCGTPPDADDLAALLARYAQLTAAAPNLPAVAQYVYETQGRTDLFRPLRRLLADACEPGPVHRFLAELPATLEGLG